LGVKGGSTRERAPKNYRGAFINLWGPHIEKTPEEVTQISQKKTQVTPKHSQERALLEK